jgi:hypothetical protein
VAKSRNFFATLCEIPTGYIPSVLESEKPSVSHRKSVGECGKIRNFFATLCEIPTGYIPSLYPSVSVAKSRNFFATLCEIPTGYIPSVLESEKPSEIRQ